MNHVTSCILLLSVERRTMLLRKKVKEVASFECAGCKYAWSDVTCVVKHSVQNMEIYFCLNCDDWIVDKSVVLQPGWSLFDLAGNLRHFK